VGGAIIQQQMDALQARAQGALKKLQQAGFEYVRTLLMSNSLRICCARYLVLRCFFGQTPS